MNLPKAEAVEIAKEKITEYLLREFLLRGTQPVVICPARSLEALRVPAAWRPSLSSERLLVLSQFTAGQHRATRDLAERRNALVSALSAGLFLAHSAPRSKTEAVVRQALAITR